MVKLSVGLGLSGFWRMEMRSRGKGLLGGVAKCQRIASAHSLLPGFPKRLVAAMVNFISPSQSSDWHLVLQLGGGFKTERNLNCIVHSAVRRRGKNSGQIQTSTSFFPHHSASSSSILRPSCWVETIKIPKWELLWSTKQKLPFYQASMRQSRDCVKWWTTMCTWPTRILSCHCQLNNSYFSTLCEVQNL